MSWTTYAATKHFEFLYINASEGTASGGHAAIKFDNDVFHFQHVEPGLLRAYRNDFVAFRFAYGDQENRSIQGHRIEVDDEVFQTLRDAFKRRLFIQNQQFVGLKALNDDRRLLDDLKQSSDEQAAPAGIALKGLGYFLENYRVGKSVDAPRSTASKAHSELTALKRAIEDQYGQFFLQHKRQEALERLIALRPSDASFVVAEDRFETAGYSFARRYQDQLSNLAALDILESGITPRPETLLTDDIQVLRLSAEAIAKLTAFREAQFADLIKLMSSERSDWGYPLLVGMARLHALDLSIQTGRLVVLDRFQPAGDDQKSFTVDAENQAAALTFAENILANVSRRLLQSEALDERDYGEIEVGASTLLRIHAAAQTKQTLPLPGLDSTPSLSANAELLQLTMSPEELESYQRVVAARLAAYGEQLQALHRYQLLNRNCVTEIFRIINDSLGRQFALSAENGESLPDSIRQVSERLLGGYIDNQGWNDIPFIAFSEVGSHYRVSSSYRLPPYRERQIDRRHDADDVLLVDLAESNTLTSSVYRWHGEDAAFLFFTQDTLWPRPLLGGLNLAVAAGQSLYGLLTWPWDYGKNLKKSLKGIAVSVPELFFFNIRKGSFPKLLPSIPVASDN